MDPISGGRENSAGDMGKGIATPVLTQSGLRKLAEPWSSVVARSKSGSRFVDGLMHRCSSLFKKR